MTSLRLGTRRSALAMAQTELVATALRRLDSAPEIEVVTITTTGDRRLDLSLLAPGPTLERGLFTREIEQALLDEGIDVAVHSLKDLPTALPDGLELVAVLPREDPADVLITRVPATLATLPTGAKVATSSARRAHQLWYFRGDLAVTEIRGNVPTRLARLVDDRSLTALVLAKAGLQRLGLSTETGTLQVRGVMLHATELPEMLPAAGQGIIGLEIKADNARARAYLERVNDRPTWKCAQAERDFLRLIGGGCGIPVGIRSWINGENLGMEAVVFEGGTNPRRAKVAVPANDHRGAAATLLEKLYED
ncbi:MAG: hydroxymethylbilane synthase [Verrucomicrobia bacterium]|nr:hydroxymethylbilane synthase [Verrucomicrobiota bacterium]